MNDSDGYGASDDPHEIPLFLQSIQPSPYLAKTCLRSGVSIWLPNLGVIAQIGYRAAPKVDFYAESEL
jgi:hypothetical protein